jgi:bifunctional DNA-binding transcriptional regulator/antitoxin component of YhaV-PrlF toxin-antitoxin module
MTGDKQLGEDAVWYGPRTLTRVRQVCIPVELLRELNLDAGSELLFALTPDGDEIRIRPTGRARKGNEKGNL